jgi:hypothetical protein
MRTIRCIALVAFTQFVPGFGQVHGDPDSSDERAQFPMVPEVMIEMLVEADKIDVPEESLPRAAEQITREHLGFGKYRIVGPGVPVDTIVTGKANADAYIAEMLASVGDEGGAPL